MTVDAEEGFNGLPGADGADAAFDGAAATRVRVDGAPAADGAPGVTGGRGGPSPTCVRAPELRPIGKGAAGDGLFSWGSGLGAAGPCRSFVDRFIDGSSSLSTPAVVADDEASASPFAGPGKSLEKMLITNYRE
jgi:hypothetical protein